MNEAKKEKGWWHRTSLRRWFAGRLVNRERAIRSEERFFRKYPELKDPTMAEFDLS